jgi:TolB protein
MKPWLLIVCLLCSVRAAAESGTLVFVATVSGNWELFVLRSGEQAPKRLTTTALDERAPALSPDGKQVAYAMSDGSLHVMNLDRGETKALELPKGVYGYPAWMPDGRGLVFTSYDYQPPHEDADLLRYDFDTGEAKPLLTQTGPQDYVAIAPDGTRIAYISSLATTLPGFGSTVRHQLWIASLRTGAPSQILLGSARDLRPDWSPDGKLLAFSSDRSGSAEIWLVAADGSKPTQLTSGPGAKLAPTWSPDGSELAYVLNASTIEIINVKTKVTRTWPLFAEPVEIRDPDWRR